MTDRTDSDVTSDRVMIFAPAPLLTVTIEQPNDEPEIHLHAGGQGVWEARMVAVLGVRVVVCAALGGEIGLVLEPLLRGENIDLKLVRRQSTSGGYVHDRRHGRREEIVDVIGHPLSRHELDDLYNLALAEGLRARVTILSGPADPSLVPAQTYRRLAADLGNNGCQVVADLSGDYLRAVLDAGVTFLKVSHEELIADGLSDDDSVASLTRAMHDLHARGARSVLVSRADEGALALVDGQPYAVEMPKLEPADPHGAGDSMTAGVAAVLARGGDLLSAVRTGAGAGALNVTRHGLGTGRREAVSSLVDRVRLTPLGDGPGDRVTPEKLAERTESR